MKELQDRPYYAEAKELYNAAKIHGDTVENIRKGLALKAFIKRHAKELSFGGEPTTALGRAVRKFTLDATALLKDLENEK